MEKPEILAPAGSMAALKAAFAAGADAVYMGGSSFGARAYAENPDRDEMIEAIRYAHLRGKRLYLTVNTLVKEQEFGALYEFLAPYYSAGLDAAIVQDVGVLRFLAKEFPDLSLHASTQMTLTAMEGIRLFDKYPVTRLVPARELSLPEITEICQKSGKEVEIFVHGALCYCYSGQCLMSSMIGGRSGNRGRCAQPCRMEYESDAAGKKYLLSPKDLCGLTMLPELINTGAASFKIEGRMKTALYVATVARTYRKAINDYLESPEKYQENMPWYLDQISNCTYRQFTTGFFYNKPTNETQIYDNNTYEKGYTYLGFVGPKNEEGLYRIEQRNKFSIGEEIEVMKPNGDNIVVTVKRMMDENVTYDVGGKETYSYEEIAKLCFEAAGKEPVIKRAPAMLFDVLAFINKFKKNGKEAILKFSKWTLTEEMVGDTHVGEMSFKQYIFDSFKK